MWSGMATIGMLAATTIAPVLSLLISYQLRRQKKTSGYHKIIFVLGLIYVPIAAVILTGLFLVVTKIETAQF